MRAMVFVATGAMLACWSGHAPAQPVFFDDFDGNALLPHWSQPPPSWWQHDVSNGMLNVTGLFFPSFPPNNYAHLWSPAFAPQADFRMDVWMGWESATAEPYVLDVTVIGGVAGLMATFRYINWLQNPPLLIAGASGNAVSASPPPPGMHHFTIARAGSQFEFYLDGALFAQLPDNVGLPATRLLFEFQGPYAGTLPPFHIDRVVVVPSPGVLGVAGFALFAFARRPRR